jgi:ataxia telangiectasia mutated family protein
MTNKAYHTLYETLFEAISQEKHSYLTAKGDKVKLKAATRMAKCAHGLRITIEVGIPKLKSNTIRAIAEHIIQTLPTSSGEYCEPLAVDYLKAIKAVLSYEAHVEHLLRDDWTTLVDFCVEGLSRYGGDAEFMSTLASRNSSFSSSLSIHKSIRSYTEELLECLHALVCATNAPVLDRSQEISSILVQILQIPDENVSVSSTQLAFSTLNAIMFHSSADQLLFIQSTVRDLIPIITRLWPSKVSTLRDELLVFLICTHLHLEKSLCDHLSADLWGDVQHLTDTMRTEYGRRHERDHLHLDDVDLYISADNFTPGTLFIPGMRLSQHNLRAERNWFLLHVLGMLEGSLLATCKTMSSESQVGFNNDTHASHPRKRRRLDGRSMDTIRLLAYRDNFSRQTVLHVLPFVLSTTQLSAEDMSDVISHLTACLNDNDGATCSWAMICFVR